MKYSSQVVRWFPKSLSESSQGASQCANQFSPHSTTKKIGRKIRKQLLAALLGSLSFPSILFPAVAAPGRSPDREVVCDLLVAGGGLAGAAAAYQALQRGQTVCLTEVTDWVGGQISSQGTSALDERATQRSQLFFPEGYLELRRRIEQRYGELNPGDCWVSASCFLPVDGHGALYEMLQDAANTSSKKRKKSEKKKGQGRLEWFPSTVIKSLEYNAAGNQITGAIAIQHAPQPGTPPLNTEPLSQILPEAYRYEDSARFKKTIIRFRAEGPVIADKPNWYVIDATETGELLGLTDVPYRLGVDPRSHLEPSSSSETADAYCPQGFTYTFAMEATADSQPQTKPAFYDQYAPYYSYELPRLASFPLVFTYRRIWSPGEGPTETFGGISFSAPTPGDISMQNWTWGNDYRPGTAQDNLIFSRDQLLAQGQLQGEQWQGGLRADALRKAEEHALGYYYWLVAGTTDSQLGDGVKKPYPNNRFLSGLDSPMGTAHGLSKHPYMREGRRVIGRPSLGHPDGFMVWELDVSRRDYVTDSYYRETLPPQMFRSLLVALSGLEVTRALQSSDPSQGMAQRTRSTIYPDSVGIGHYAIDFHPCMTLSPPEAPGNQERAGERRGAGQAYPFQIPLRAMIPQKLDNLLVTGKSIATSHIAAAAYRVHSFEWSSGIAAGETAAFALERAIAPYELVDNLPLAEPELAMLQKRLVDSGNPIAFPDTSIFNNQWDDWR